MLFLYSFIDLIKIVTSLCICVHYQCYQYRVVIYCGYTIKLPRWNALRNFELRLLIDAYFFIGYHLSIFNIFYIFNYSIIDTVFAILHFFLVRFNWVDLFIILYKKNRKRTDWGRRGVVKQRVTENEIVVSSMPTQWIIF